MIDSGETFTVKGGANVGWINVSSPLAKLTVSAEALELRVSLLGNYVFAPESVTGITRYRAFFGGGIQINHLVASYPERVIFSMFGDPDNLIRRIREAGFEPKGVELPASSRQGVPVRWQSVAILIAGWYGLFLLDYLMPGRKRIPLPLFAAPYAMLALAMVFAGSIAVRRVAILQRFILKEGRDAGEIRHLLGILTLVSGLLLRVFRIISDSIASGVISVGALSHARQAGMTQLRYQHNFS